MNICPECHSLLETFYSSSRQVLVCQCPNPQCELCRRQVEATGEHTREAEEHFAGLAMGFEILPAGRRSR